MNIETIISLLKIFLSEPQSIEPVKETSSTLSAQAKRLAKRKTLGTGDDFSDAGTDSAPAVRDLISLDPEAQRPNPAGSFDDYICLRRARRAAHIQV